MASRKRLNDRHQQMVRDKICATQTLNAIQEVEDIVRENWKTLESNQIQALKLRQDTSFRKLNKILPDLKAIDADFVHSGEMEVKLVNFLDVDPKQLET